MPVLAAALATTTNDSSSSSKSRSLSPPTATSSTTTTSNSSTPTAATLDSCRLLLKYLFCRRHYDCGASASRGVHRRRANLENNTTAVLVVSPPVQQEKLAWPSFDSTSSRRWKLNSFKRRSDTSSIISNVSTTGGVDDSAQGFYHRDTGLAESKENSRYCTEGAR